MIPTDLNFRTVVVSASPCASSRNTALRDDSDGSMDPKYEFRYTANANNAARPPAPPAPSV